MLWSLESRPYTLHPTLFSKIPPRHPKIFLIFAAHKYLEGCPSGLRSTLGKRVYAKSVSRVRIPSPLQPNAPKRGIFVFRSLKSEGHQANKNQNEPSDAGAGHWVDTPPPRDHERSEYALPFYKDSQTYFMQFQLLRKMQLFYGEV